MERLYRTLLSLYPRSHRREYGSAMLETFARKLSDSRHKSVLGRLGFLLSEFLGVIASAGHDRFGEPFRRHRQGRRGGGVTELRQALRRLLRSPGFTLAAVLTLGVAIGGNAAIFAVLNSIVISPLPYLESDRLVRVAVDVESVNAHGIEIPIGFWLGYRRLNETFDDIGLFDYGSVNVSGEGAPERLEAIFATGSLFSTLAVPPAHGRTIQEIDEAPGTPPVAVLSHGLWTRRYAADPGVVGRTIRLDNIAVEVVGVMPAGFAFPRPGTQIWLPLTIDRGGDPPISFSYSSIGRLSEGVSIERAHEDLSRATRRLPALFGNLSLDFIEDNGVSPSLRSYKSAVIGDVADTLWLLLGALGFVLLIACANVANLFLVRTEARRREVGVRAALGASRGDLVRYLLSESLVIGVAAGAAGLAMALAGVRLLVRLGPTDVPRLEEVGIGTTELGFTVAISLLVAVVFGSLPIARLARLRLVDQLRDAGERTTAGGSARRATTTLVVGQVSLALLLTVGAALFAQSLGNLLRIDPGFEADSVLTFRLSLPRATYPDGEQRARFHQQLLDRLEALPGVEAAGLTRCLPLQGWCGGNPVSSPDSPLPPEGFRKVASIKPVSPGYFRALGMTLRAGRAIERADHETRSGAAVLSAALAARLFPGMEPIGKRVYPSAGGPDDDADWYTVVGVAGTVKRLELDEEPAEILYVPMLGTDDRSLPSLSEVVAAIRTEGEPTAWAASVRRAVRELDEDVPLAAIEPMTSILSRASARVGFTATLIGIAAIAALLLGAVGLYGVVTHTVGRRTAEIGVRMALGARQQEVVRMVVRQGLAVALAGVGLGVVGVLALARVVRALLYEVSPEDPLTLLVASSALLAVATVASYLPARRAARVDPVIALKRE